MSSSPSVNLESGISSPPRILSISAEIRGGEHAQVLAILLVDALNVFRNHQLDAGTKLGIGRLLTAGTFAATLPAHRRHKAALLHVTALDGRFIAALQAGVWELAQRFVEEEADVRRRDLVGGDVITQFGIILRILSCPTEGLPPPVGDGSVPDLR